MAKKTNRSAYNKAAVEVEMKKAGVNPKSKEVKMIHALLKGRGK